MNMRDNSIPRAALLPALVAVIVLCLAGAAVLTLLTNGASPTAAPADQSSLILQRIPFEAQNALRGEATAFDALPRASPASTACAVRCRTTSARMPPGTS